MFILFVQRIFQYHENKAKLTYFDCIIIFVILSHGWVPVVLIFLQFSLAIRVHVCVSYVSVLRFELRWLYGIIPHLRGPQRAGMFCIHVNQFICSETQTALYAIIHCTCSHLLDKLFLHVIALSFLGLCVFRSPSERAGLSKTNHCTRNKLRSRLCKVA